MTTFKNAQLHYGPEPTVEDCDKIYDICILGSGAAGSVAAHALVKAGFEVLILERGPFVQETTTYDDILMSSEGAFARNPSGTWSLIGYPWTTCNVGGGTLFYGGASFRYREVDFDADHYFADSELPLKWPYTYEALAPFYTQVEELIGVAGDPLGDPLAPKGYRSLPLPPVPQSFSAMSLMHAAKKMGLKPFSTPLAIAVRDFAGRKQYCAQGASIENVCHQGSKGDVFTVFLKALFQKSNFRLFAGLKAHHFTRSKKEKIEKICAIHEITGKVYHFKAKTFIVACNAIQSAALLLRSVDSWSPNGIGNEHDMVGRGLCFKMSQYVVGYLPKIQHFEQTQLGPFSTFSLMDFYLDQRCPGGVGGLIYESRYGYDYPIGSKNAILRLEALLADQPMINNRIKVTSDSTIVIDYRSHPRDLARLKYMTSRCEDILKEAGCSVIFQEESEYALGSTHLHGTCRSHAEPRLGVLDLDSRVHSVENLYVIDGSFMPYPGGVNPTLTIQAHALKIASQLATSLRS